MLTVLCAYQVNRGQGIATFGIETKDKPLLEFQTANKAYEVAQKLGFRTFVQIEGEEGVYEPFSTETTNYDSPERGGPVRDMIIGMNDVRVSEENSKLGLHTDVLYFTLPGLDFGGMVRKTTFTNTGSIGKRLSSLDGPASFEPNGVDDWHLKNMGRTLEAWFKVYNMKGSDNKQPFVKLTASLADTAISTEIVQGNWALSFTDDGTPLPFVVDPSVVFGQDTALNVAQELKSNSIKDIVNGVQVTVSKTPCMFSGADGFDLAPGASATITTIYGVADNFDEFIDHIIPTVSKKGFADAKQNEAEALTDRLTAQVRTKSGSKAFDLYAQQMMLDNLLRGGYPELLGADNDPKVFHTFSRIHGDMERDYNYFLIAGTYFSVGPGNFRDVNQNRRVDGLQQPKVGSFNVNMFLSFIQADGYNPLTVESVEFYFPDDANNTIVELLTASVGAQDALTLASALSKPFKPGDVFSLLKRHNIKPSISPSDFVNLLVGQAESMPVATFAQNGFWADHWTYTQDLIDTYLAVFPDQEEELLFDAAPIPYYMSPAVMLPRSRRYVLSDLGPRQYNFIYTSEARVKIMKWGSTWMRTPDGQIFTSSAFTKLLVLAATKFMLLDPEGMGLEMEGGKPGWNDAMNGLCAMFGSGMPEMYELLRLLTYIKRVLESYPDRMVQLPIEVDSLYAVFANALSEYGDGSVDDADHVLWDTVAHARDDYRNATSVYFSGHVVSHSTSEMLAVVRSMESKIRAGTIKAVNWYGGISPTYFIYEVTDYEVLPGYDDEERPYVKVNAFRPAPVPIFLEGPVRQMKTLLTYEERLQVFEMVRNSALYDRKLQMYKISGSLEGMSTEIGRMTAFSPGWLENESVWLHMSYKWYLELLRGGLYDQFWEELKTGLVAFMDPLVYGRSPLECASFIVSSDHPDPSIHGQGYLPRLSGSTAEYLSMWNHMTSGRFPFISSKEGLQLKLEPVLPSWLFDDQGKFSFVFLGGVNITYHNPSMINTWGESTSVAKTTLIYETGQSLTFTQKSGVVHAPFAADVRAGKVQAIDVFYN
jgi:hypothetical protein